MTELQTQSTVAYMTELWPDWNNTGALLQQFQEMFKYTDEDKALAVLKRARFKNDYKTPPYKYISAEIERVKKHKKVNRIMVYALRDDGKSDAASCAANNPEHAREVMRNHMLYWYDKKGYDCNPDQFTFYIGEENYYNFTAARRKVLR